MKKSILLGCFVVLSASVFGTNDNPGGLVKLYRTDSPRFQLGIRDFSESQTSFTQVYISQTQGEQLNEESSDVKTAVEEDDSVHSMEELNPSRFNLRKRQKVAYLQSDSWPQERDDSQDLDYVYSFSDTNNTNSRLLEKKSVDSKSDDMIQSLGDIFEDVLSLDESNSFQYNLRKRQKVAYLQSDSWPRERDDSQDLDYVYSFLDADCMNSHLKGKGAEGSQNESFDSSLEGSFVDVLADKGISSPQQSNNGQVQNSVEIPKPKTRRLSLKLNKSGRHKKILSLVERNLIPSRENSPKDSVVYQEKELNLIKTEKSLQKYKEFPCLETLKITLGDLSHANTLEFPNLKELYIDVRKIAAKTSKIEPVREHGGLRQRHITNFFRKDQTEILQDFLTRNPNLETFYFGYYKPAKLPSALWDSKKLKNLTLKKLVMAEIPSEIEKLTNLETLDLSNNKIKWLPEAMCNLERLETLTLIGNDSLEVFPDVIRRLADLKVLKIDKMQKNRWRKSLQELKNINENLNIEVW